MSDLISRQAAIDAINKNRDPVFHDSVHYEDAVYDISKLPSAEPERKKGKWIEIENEWGGLEIICSECGAQVPRDAWGDAIQSDYCYRCGADMRGEEK